MGMEMSREANGHATASVSGPVVDEAAQMAEQARAALEEAQEQVVSFIRERPLLCLAGALAVGYAIGKIVSR
jgi:hypothetical protein